MTDMTVDAGIDISPEGDRGVLKRIIKEGEGTETPNAGCEVSVHYTGTLLDGTKFDSSKDRNEPFEFQLGKHHVIKAWDIGVATMKKGEVCVLTCAPKYAYGDRGSPPKIPPKATLLFEIEMLDWKEEDLSPNKNKGILRHIIEPGGGEQPQSDAEVTVELEGKLQADGKVFDKRTVSFVLGEGCEVDVCEGVERALESFHKGERSRLTIQPKYAFKNKGNEKLGVPSNAVVEYTVTLKDFVQGKELWLMNEEELIEEAKLCKEKGTEYFKEGKFQLAIKKYKKVFTYLKDKQEGNVSESEHNKQSKEILLSTHLNLALVYLKVSPAHYFKAVEHADKALALRPGNVKGLFRRGQALLGLGEAERARDDFQRVIQAEPDNKAAANQLVLCRAAIQKQREKDRQLYVNMFDKFAKHDNEVEQRRARSEAAAGGGAVGEWGAGAGEGEWTEKQRDRKPTHFEQENPNILMLDRDGRFQNM